MGFSVMTFAPDSSPATMKSACVSSRVQTMSVSGRVSLSIAAEIGEDRRIGADRDTRRLRAHGILVGKANEIDRPAETGEQLLPPQTRTAMPRPDQGDASFLRVVGHPQSLSGQGHAHFIRCLESPAVGRNSKLTNR